MNKFWAGVLTAISYISLRQDYLGKDEYLRLVNDKWIDPGITVPLALALLVCAWVTYHNN